jgi:hypothetical protein
LSLEVAVEEETELEGVALEVIVQASWANLADQAALLNQLYNLVLHLVK